MFDHLDKNEFKNFMDHLLILLGKYDEFVNATPDINSETAFLTKFYRFPQIK
jgi:hypothetical protein